MLFEFDAPLSAHERVLRASVDCIARWGTTKTTLDDIARAAEMSRATIYRLFPGGKPALIEAVGERELAIALWQIHDVFVRSATLEDLLVDTLWTAARLVRGHRALNYLLTHEVEVLLPFLSFEGFERVLDAIVEFCRPSLERFVDHELAGELAEWGTRLLVCFALRPVPYDLTRRDDAARLIDTIVMPGIAAASSLALVTS